MNRVSRQCPGVFIILLSTCFVVVACGGGVTTADPFESPAGFEAALRQAGAVVRPGNEQGPPVLDIPPQSLYIGDELVWVYPMKEPLDSSLVVEAFAGEPFVWTKDHLIVKYGGSEGGLILLIDGILGEALIKPSAAGNEPYPPAIPAAISKISGTLGIEPSEVEVRTYANQDWKDACLELSQPGEACAQVITPGWRILLKVGAREIEVHTDYLGENVRWNAP